MRLVTPIYSTCITNKLARSSNLCRCSARNLGSRHLRSSGAARDIRQGSNIGQRIVKLASVLCLDSRHLFSHSKLNILNRLATLLVSADHLHSLFLVRLSNFISDLHDAPTLPSSRYKQAFAFFASMSAHGFHLFTTFPSITSHTITNTSTASEITFRNEIDI